MHHSIRINASKEKVWQVLWDDKTLRDWANIIDEGTYLVGDLQEGKEVRFMSGSGYGVASKVEELIPGERMVLRHVGDIKVGADGSIESRDKQWAGGMETYELKEDQGTVELSITQEAPEELVEYFEGKMPQVLERIKVLAETNQS